MDSSKDCCPVLVTMMKQTHFSNFSACRIACEGGQNTKQGSTAFAYIPFSIES